MKLSGVKSNWPRAICHYLVFSWACCILLNSATAGELLYNGIKLPNQWPPNLKQLPQQLPAPRYLKTPPDVIDITVGRQLFVDDFLIERTTLERRFHAAQYHPANPILTYDRPWEMSKSKGGLPTACPYSGGVWYDPEVKKFRMWYMGGYIEHLCLAESDDGIHWTKPEFDVRSGTNIVVWRGATESNSLLMDLNAADRNRRFKYFMTNIGKGWKTEYRHSADGVHWSEPVWLSGAHGDRTTVFFNPFRKRWVFALRTSDRSGHRLGRSKRYWETQDIDDAESVQWSAVDGRFDANAPFWVSADRGLDRPRREIGIAPQLYHLDCVAYESVMLGMFNILRGDFHENDGEGRDAFPGRPKCAEVCLGFSRDGFHWDRPTHETFIGISEKRGDWNWGNVQSAGNSMLVVGDHLYFYVSGRRGAGGNEAKGSELLHPAYAGCSTGLAVLRRDGFASMDAPPPQNELKEGTQRHPTDTRTLTTRKLRFSGSRLFVNVDNSHGLLRVEILDEDENVIAPFSKSNCKPIAVNKTLQQVHWHGGGDLSKLAGKPAKLRFYLSNGSLYSFWVTKDESGASNGFVAGGGPAFVKHHDTVGDASRDYRPLVPTKSKRTKADVLSPDAMVMWLKADGLVDRSDGASVRQWRDSSNNQLNGFQDDVKKQPVLKLKAINGRPALRFDGVDDYLLLDHYPGLFQTFYQSTIFVVAKSVKGGTLLSQAHTNLTVTQAPSRRLNYSSSFSDVDHQIQWPQIQTNQLRASKNAELYTLIRSGNKANETKMFVNQQRVDQGKAFPFHKVSPIEAYVGAAYRLRNHWHGDIAEILVYNRALNEGELRTVERYLANKYGIGND